MSTFNIPEINAPSQNHEEEIQTRKLSGKKTSGIHRGRKISDINNERMPLLGNSYLDEHTLSIQSNNSFTNSVRSFISGFPGSLSSSIRHLQKSVGFLQGFSFIVGILIGSGVFISPSLVMADVKDVGFSFVVWIICGLIALGGSLCYCELGCSLKRAGGNYAYIMEAYGSLPAFLCCWTVGFIVDPSATATITLTFGNYVMKTFENFIEPDPLYPKLVAVVCILIIAFINCWSVKASTFAQTLFSFAQIIAVLFIVIVGIVQLAKGKTDHHRFEGTFNITKISNVGMIGKAMYDGLWAYDGWALVANITEEMTNLDRNLFLSIITGIPFVIGCFILINISLLSALDVSEMGASKAVAVTFIEKTLGTKCAYIMPIFVAVSCYGAANGTIFAAARLSLAAGREGHLPEIFSMIHKKKNTPIPAVLMTSMISLLMLIPDSSSFEFLISIFNFSCWFVYGLTIFGVIILRYREPDMHRPYKVWLITPIIMTIISICLVIIPFFQDPVNPLIGTAMIGSGIPFYYAFVYFESSHPDCVVRLRKSITKKIKKRLNLAPCSMIKEEEEEVK